MGFRTAGMKNSSHVRTPQFHASTLSGPHVPQILFLTAFKIHNLQCSYPQHLKQQMRKTAASLTPDVLGFVWEEMD
jgi:hypothetical protein